MMTSTERVMGALRHRRPDRVPIYESFWPEFIQRWRREKALPADADIDEYYQFDLISRSKVIADQTPWPSRARLVERGDRYCVRRSGWGELVRELDSTSVGELIEPPLKRPSDLAKMPPFEPVDMAGLWRAGDPSRLVDGDATR